MRRGSWLQFAIGGLLAGGMTAGLCFAQQQVISAQSGMVQYVEGTVYANGHLVERKFAQFPALRKGGELRTEDGRAEVLLTPGAFLRVTDHSSVLMLSNQLSDTRVEVLNGSVMVECDELLKDNAVSLVYKGNTIQLEKHGLYRLETAAEEFRVYDGEAVIHSASGETTLRAGKQANLGAVLVTQRFDRKSDLDDFYNWSSQRSSNLAYATITTSQSVLNNGTTWHSGGWMWSSLLDEFTYLPGGGLVYSPFGWGFWSPVYMGYYYTPVYYTGGAPITKTGNSGTGKPGRSGPGTVAGGAATNPRGGAQRPVPSFGVTASSRPGASYGGVAALGVGGRGGSSGFAGFRGGSGGFEGMSAGGFSRGSGGGGYAGGSSGGGGGFGSSGGGGFHGGGGFGGGHAGAAGGGGHR